MLTAKRNDIFYYTFNDDKSENRRYEIDFLLPKKNKICPMEIKSSGYRTHVSLDKFSS